MTYVQKFNKFVQVIGDWLDNDKYFHIPADVKDKFQSLHENMNAIVTMLETSPLSGELVEQMDFVRRSLAHLRAHRLYISPSREKIERLHTDVVNAVADYWRAADIQPPKHIATAYDLGRHYGNSDPDAPYGAPNSPVRPADPILVKASTGKLVHAA